MGFDGEMPGMSKREFLRCALMGLAGCCLHDGRMLAAADFLGKTPAAEGAAFAAVRRKESLYYSMKEGVIRCGKCPNFCELRGSEKGKCRNREASGGKLWSLGYGEPCALHIDPIEKKPLYHFHPASRAYSIAVAGCNLRCLNCQNWQISQFSPEETENMDLPPEKAVEDCLRSGSESIAYTYSEPTTFYEYTLDTAVLARGKKIRNVLKSNGYINEEPLRNLARNLDAANIDLKTFDDAVYRKLSSARLAPVLKTLKTLKEEGVWLEITNLVVPSWSDDMGTIRKMSEWLAANGLADSPLHFTRFMPLYKLTQLPMTPVETLEQARGVAMKAGMKFVYIGNVPGHEAENTYCPKCGKIAIERRGYRIGRISIRRGNCVSCGERIPGRWDGEAG